MTKHTHTQCLSNNWILDPEFAYKLIGCLSIAFVLGVLGAVAMYFYASVMSETSEYRKNFNNGYTQSRDFFEKNEMLLAGMIKGVDFVPGSAAPASASERKSFYLESLSALDGRKGILNLSAQMRQELRESNVNIIYMDRAAGVARYVLNSGTNRGNKLKEVFEQLQGVDWAKNVGSGLQVFQLGTGSEKKSYIFESFSPRLMPNAWLGLEIPHARVQESIMSEMTAAPELGVKYLILDKGGRVVSGVPEPDPGKRGSSDFLNALSSKGDGFESYGAPVFKLSLKKELGGGQRWIVYYASYDDVLWRMRYSVVFGCLVFLASVVSAYIIMRYVRRAVFLPAQEQAVQLLEREEFNRTMLKLAPVGICVFSRKSGELLVQSEKAKAMLASYVEMGGCRATLRDFFMSIQFTDGEVPYRTGVTTFTTNENTPRYIHVSLAELQYNEQPVLFCSFVDDSERRNAELMLASAKEAADEANAAKSTFLAMMSHEIRTPLYGVLGTLELLANTTLLPPQRGYLNTIEHSSSNLLHIIDDILDFSKIEASQLALESGQFNLIELAQDVARSFVSLARKKGVELYCCPQPDLPLLLGDRNRLQQVLNNLLSNAVKFTDSGKIVI
ncbi:two-component sensor histidine kinase, partial [Pseudomonas fluorescens]